MQYQWHCCEAFLAQACPSYKFAGMISGLFFPDLPANDIAAEDVNYKVQEKEQPLDGFFQVGDIPFISISE